MKKTRVQLDLPPEAMDRLRRLRKSTEAVSHAEVVRNALKLMEFVHDNEIEIRRLDGTVVNLRLV